ncbi:hypothetical protein Hanom_Chr11g01012991 [Helianthus anomalus]
MLGLLCTESPEDVDVQALKAKYQTLLNEKPSWLNDAEERRENETGVINQVLTELNLEMGNIQGDDSTGEDDTIVDIASPSIISPIVASQYRKTIEKERNLKTKTKRRCYTCTWVTDLCNMCYK